MPESFTDQFAESTDNTMVIGIRKHFEDAAENFATAAASLAPVIEDASGRIVNAFMANHRVFTCGNGGSASDAEHLAAELVGRLERDRPALPAFALSANSSVLTAVANDYGYQDVFARQVRAHGSAGDVLIAISCSGNSANVVEAVAAAHEREMQVIALSGADPGKLGEQLSSQDCLISVPATRIMRVQELHRVCIHALCDAVDRILLGE
jgi:D-sedoheptulose 7-phosphate isomerase